jgi:hypothetical protein
MDAGNPIVMLCSQGMQAEAQGDNDTARVLFEQAWGSAADDYERCIASHYLARHQESPESTLRWNEECLRYANQMADERVAAFYPSLHLNLGFCREQLGDVEGARESYRLAEASLASLGDDAYSDLVRDGVRRALDRVDLR